MYAWSARSTDKNNAVGADYIIVEKADGVVLSSPWPTMNTDQKHRLIQSIIAFERSLLSHNFDKIGSLYCEADLVGSQNKFSGTAYAGFVVGPTTDRKFFEDGRRNINPEKGPCRCPFIYLTLRPCESY